MSMVSLIVPCYNMEKYINDTIDSILLQTFKDIELIIVNDGSTDSSEEIILSRKSEIETSLSAFKYIKQKNAGLGGACQTGFKNATGNYFMLLDGDDCLLSSSIEKQQEFLEKNKDYAAVRTNGYYTYPDEDGEKKYLFENGTETDDKIAVWKDIFYGNVHALAGGYMIRMSVLDEIYPSRDIYTSCRGQNLQFLLVASYHRKVGYIDDPLIMYYVRHNSMSHRIETDQKKREIDLLEGYKDIRKHIVNCFFCEKDKEEFLKENEILYAKMFLKIANKYKDKKMAIENYEILKTATGNHVDKNDKRLFLFTKYPAYQALFNFIIRIRRKSKVFVL